MQAFFSCLPGGDEEEYVPPKPEVKEVEEEGSLYSKKYVTVGPLNKAK